MSREGVRRFYDGHARARAEWWAGMLDVESELEASYRDRAEKRTVGRLLGDRRFECVVEVGCGAGRWLDFLSARADRVVGVDLSMTLLGLARQRAHPRPGSLVAADAAALPLQRPWGLVYLSCVCLHLQDEALRLLATACAGLLAPGGLLLSRDSLSRGLRFEQAGEYGAIYRGADEYLRLFGAAGFRPLKQVPAYRRLRRPGILHRLERIAGRRAVARLDDRFVALLDLAANASARLLRRPGGRGPDAGIEHRFFLYARGD